MKPILQNKAAYRKWWIGIPKNVQASLYKDHIELEKNNKVVANFPLSQITSAGIKPMYGTTTLWMKLENGKRVGLEFKLRRSVLLSMFGWVGILLGFYTGEGVKTSQQWVTALGECGVNTKLSSY